MNLEPQRSFQSLQMKAFTLAELLCVDVQYNYYSKPSGSFCPLPSVQHVIAVIQRHNNLQFLPYCPEQSEKE